MNDKEKMEQVVRTVYRRTTAETTGDGEIKIAKEEICKVFGLKKCPSKMIDSYVDMVAKMATQLVQELSDEEAILAAMEPRQDHYGENATFASALRRGTKILAMHS